MNLQMPFVPSQRTREEDAAKVAKAEQARTAKQKPALKAAATAIVYKMTDAEIELAKRYGGRARCSEIHADGTVVDLIDDEGNWIGPDVGAKAVDDEDDEIETPTVRARKHAELRRVLDELRANN
jgi:hypothetical protein